MATLDQEVSDSPTINANCDENIHNDDVKCDNSGEICDEKQDDTVERTNILPDQPESEHSNIKIDGKTEIIDGNTDHDNNESQTDQSNLQQAENKSHTELEKCGCLMKRKKVSHKWENTYFQLKNSSLHYGHPSQSETQKKNLKEIPLLGAEIIETEIDKKQHVISIKPKSSKRTYYIQTTDKEQLDDWLQALCYAKVGGNKDGNSEACVIQ